MDAKDVLTRFIAAVAAGDFETMRSLYADDVRIWHSTDRAWQEGADANVAVAKRTLAGIGGFRHDAHTIMGTDTGAIAEGSLRGTIGGKEMDTPFCLVATISGGKITEGREYIDQGHLPRG
ncbi:MAG: nuclear transport factor 2 family protein [Dehalococcoidia bacterium]